ncbi:MAG TPA: hypothetical protein PK228_03750 [Saprospiraceae bacterium]|nr:hypothetical protein [Saprospiraceae bacterium]
MLRTLSCLPFLAFLTVAGWSQGAKPPVTGVGIVYNRETTFNFKLTTNRGFAAGMEFGKLRTYYKTTCFNISIGELKNAKEQRQSADPQVSRSFRPYVFGKQNNLFMLRGGWGAKRYFSEKAKQKGVAMGMNYSFGPTLGLLKPYYLALRRVGDTPGQSRVTHEKYSEENADIFLDNTRILGASPFTKGFNELSLLPGANASIALHLDWGAFDEFVKAFEIGLMLDVFFKDAPILVDQNSPMFFNFFINLQLGKRR